MRPITITPDVRAALSTVTVAGAVVRIEERLDRSLYERVNKALEALGGKWSRKAKGHVFEEGDPEGRLENALLTGKVVDLKKAYDFFETPRDVADLMINLAPPAPGMRVLEPSAGRGALALRVRKRCPECLIHCIELEPDRAQHLRDERFLVCENDFLKIDPVRDVPGGPYDRVYMNPPFSKQQDLDHVRHAFRFLKPGGVLVSVLAAGVTFRENRKTVEFREWMAPRRLALRELPAGSFRESGTDVHAVLLALSARPGACDCP